METCPSVHFIWASPAVSGVYLSLRSAGVLPSANTDSCPERDSTFQPLRALLPRATQPVQKGRLLSR